ncbi:MAG TPA: prephenate dehydratase [Candidatus Limnocylindrales bacterium]
MSERQLDPEGDTAPEFVAYAGEPGAFAEDAVLAAFGDVPRTGVGGFREVFEAVEAGRSGAGAVPIENLVGGTVRENYDLLLDHAVDIVGEVVVPVRLCLAALPGSRLDAIERVYSHSQALSQAESFLRTRPWTVLTTYNTAGAGKLIADRDEAGSAAVLSPRAAGLFGLQVLVDDVADQPDNRTRFLVIGREGQTPRPAWKAPIGSERRTILVFGVRNEPGTLLGALQAFAERGVNLSRLESRPSRQGAWEYVFWVDVDAGVDERACAAAIDALRDRATMIRVLGSYPKPAGD